MCFQFTYRKCIHGNKALHVNLNKEAYANQRGCSKYHAWVDCKDSRGCGISRLRCHLPVHKCPTCPTLTLSQDWNTFLLRFNELDFCVSENETIKHGLNESTTPESMVVTSGQARSSTQVPLLLEDSGPINISVPITLTLDPQRPFGGYSRNITHLYATVLGQQVGLSGRFSFSSSLVCICPVVSIRKTGNQVEL